MFFKNMKRMLALLLALICVLGSLPNTANAAELEDYGMLRLMLSSMGSVKTVNATVSGNYTIGGDPNRVVKNGQAVTVTMDAKGLYLAIGSGEKTAMGTQFTLVRHGAAIFENCMKIKTEGVYRSYPGDVTFMMNGTTSIHTIVKLHIEDYVCGVVPYEMSDSFPLESLKAQAVTARTYAMIKMAYESKNYDLVDTTSDQVYKGSYNSNANAVRAAQETRGVALYYAGSMVKAYYAASNGGQTELPSNVWGGGANLPYQVIKEDPYDVENASSRLKTLNFPKDLQSGYLTTKMKTLLLPAVQEKLKGMGYLSQVDDFTLLNITSALVDTPKFAPPSRMMTRLVLGVKVSASKEGSPAKDVDVSIALSLFGQIKPTFDLGHQSVDREIFVIEDCGDHFQLQSRRYGHGVGMSQRGAQQMAKAYAFRYNEILQFYYQGTTLVPKLVTRADVPAVGQWPSTNGSPTPRPTLTPVPSSTPSVTATIKPSATPVPTPTVLPGATLAQVNVGSGSGLYLRQKPDTTAQVLATMPHSSYVQVLETKDDWCKVIYNGITGYAKQSYLKMITVTSSTKTPTAKPNVTPTVTPTTVPTLNGRNAIVTLSDNSKTLVLRAAADINGAKVDSLSNGTVLKVLALGPRWFKVQAGNKTGFVDSAYLVPQQKITAYVKLQDPASSLILRKEPTASSAKIISMRHGAAVTVLFQDGTWAKIQVLSKIGYVKMQYLKMP